MGLAWLIYANTEFFGLSSLEKDQWQIKICEENTEAFHEGWLASFSTWITQSALEQVPSKALLTLILPASQALTKFLWVKTGRFPSVDQQIALQIKEWVPYPLSELFWIKYLAQMNAKGTQYVIFIYPKKLIQSLIALFKGRIQHLWPEDLLKFHFFVKRTDISIWIEAQKKVISFYDTRTSSVTIQNRYDSMTQGLEEFIQSYLLTSKEQKIGVLGENHVLATAVLKKREFKQIQVQTDFFCSQKYAKDFPQRLLVQTEIACEFEDKKCNTFMPTTHRWHFLKTYWNLHRRRLMQGLGCLSCFFFILGIYFQINTHLFDSKTQQLRTQITQVKMLETRIANTQEEIDRLNEDIQKVNRLNARKADWNPFFAVIETLVSAIPNTWIENFIGDFSIEKVPEFSFSINFLKPNNGMDPVFYEKAAQLVQVLQKKLSLQITDQNIQMGDQVFSIQLQCLGNEAIHEK